MNDRMAVWTYRPQFANGIPIIFPIHLGHRHNVVHTNHPVADGPVLALTLEIAHETAASVVCQSGSPCRAASLEGVDRDRLTRTLGMQRRLLQLLGDWRHELVVGRVPPRTNANQRLSADLAAECLDSSWTKAIDALALCREDHRNLEELVAILLN